MFRAFFPKNQVTKLVRVAVDTFPGLKNGIKNVGEFVERNARSFTSDVEKVVEGSGKDIESVVRETEAAEVTIKPYEKKTSNAHHANEEKVEPVSTPKTFADNAKALVKFENPRQDNLSITSRLTKVFLDELAKTKKINEKLAKTVESSHPRDQGLKDLLTKKKGKDECYSIENLSDEQKIRARIEGFETKLSENRMHHEESQRLTNAVTSLKETFNATIIQEHEAKLEQLFDKLIDRVDLLRADVVGLRHAEQQSLEKLLKKTDEKTTSGIDKIKYRLEILVAISAIIGFAIALYQFRQGLEKDKEDKILSLEKERSKTERTAREAHEVKLHHKDLLVAKKTIEEKIVHLETCLETCRNQLLDVQVKLTSKENFLTDIEKAFMRQELSLISKEVRHIESRITEYKIELKKTNQNLADLTNFVDMRTEFEEYLKKIDQQLTEKDVSTSSNADNKQAADDDHHELKNRPF